MSVKERLISFIKSVQGGKESNISLFEKTCGLKNSTISNIRVSIGPKNLAKIKEKYPELNEIWLLHNQGEMFLNANEKPKKSVNMMVDSNVVLSRLVADSILHQATLNVLQKTLESISAQVKGTEAALVSGQLHQAIKFEADRLSEEYSKTQKQLSS